MTTNDSCTSAINQLQQVAAAVQELAQADDLAELAATFPTVSSDRLRDFVTSIQEAAERLDSVAGAFAQARPEDILYPDLASDLRSHGWTSLDVQTLDTQLAARDLTAEIPARRGVPRGFQRDGHVLVLWFTGLPLLAGGYSSEVGWLFDEQELRAVLTSPSDRPLVPDRMDPARPWACPVSFDSSINDVD